MNGIPGPVLIPKRAHDQWRALSAALRVHGPAACEQSPDAEDWWPAQRDDTTSAQAVCRSCPVRTECAAYALAARESAGIWGGLTPEERAR